MIMHKYTVDVKVVNGRKILDLNDLKYIFALEFGEPKAKTLPPFSEQVKDIWFYCLDKEPKPWENIENIKGYALNNVFYFNKNRLKEKTTSIVSLLTQVTHAMNYDDLKKLNNGEQWTQFRYYVEMIMSLGNALNLISIKEKNKNPEVVFTLTRK